MAPTNGSNVVAAGSIGDYGSAAAGGLGMATTGDSAANVLASVAKVTVVIVSVVGVVHVVIVVV